MAAARSPPVFGIDFKAWTTRIKRPHGREPAARMERRSTTQDGARQEFVDTQPAATYIGTEFWRVERPLASVPRGTLAEPSARSSAPIRALDELVV